MQILQVVPITKSITSEVLTYFSAKTVLPGQLVTVPLRKKEISAIVVHAESVINMKTQLRGANYQIRNVLHVHEGHVFSQEFLSTCTLLKNFYATSTGRIIEKYIPSFILKDVEKYITKNIGKTNGTMFQTKLLQRNYKDRIGFYKTLIREKQFQKESLQIICPTIESTKILFNELQKNNANCFTLHSGLSSKKLKETYLQISKLETPSVVISTSLFIDIFQYKKNTIIIEHDSSDYYRSIVAPFVDARVFIQNYAQKKNIELIIADSILRPEVWYQHTHGSADIIEPFDKKVFKNNTIQIVNQHIKKPGKQTDKERIEELTNKQKFSFLSKVSIDILETSIKNKEKIFLFTPKKSLAPTIVCNDCGNMAVSPVSGNPYSLYIKTHPKTRIKERIFICNKTGESIPAFDICQFCHSWRMQSLGIGTEGVLSQIEELFPKTKTFIIDGNHNKTKKQLRECVEEYHSSKESIIIIGTQKALSYIHTIDTAIVVSLDSYFARMSYNINTQVLSLLNNIVEKTHNPIILQSRNITEDTLPIIQNGLYREYIESELTERKQFNYPPYSTLCTITRTIVKTNIKKEYKLLNNLFDDYQPQILIHPGKTKKQVKLIVILELKHQSWNYSYQDEKLWGILSAFDRKTEIRINPKDLV